MVCAATGHVLAGALGIALAYSPVIAKNSARLGCSELNIGAFPIHGLGAHLSRYRPASSQRTDDDGQHGRGLGFVAVERLGGRGTLWRRWVIKPTAQQP